MIEDSARREKKWWEHYPFHKWWCNDLCPLVPRFFYRKGDKYNANKYGVHWLVFEVYSMDHFSIGIDAGISFNEVYVGASLPYLRIVVGIRHYYFEWTWKLSCLLHRKPAIKKTENE